MADQYARTRDALAARYPGLTWLVTGHEVGAGAALGDDGLRAGSLRIWLRRVRGGPGWVVRADLDRRTWRSMCIPVETSSADPVDAVGVVLRCLASSARNEGWNVLADAVAAVERHP